MKTLTKTQESEMSAIKTISDKIRFLDKLGYSRAEIAKALQKRYQHVRNVLTMPIKKGK